MNNPCRLVFRPHENYFYWELDIKLIQDMDSMWWEDPWIYTTPTRSALPNAPVVHPRMTVSNLINRESKKSNVGLLIKIILSRMVYL